MGRETIQLEDAVSTISGEYLLKFTSEYGIPEDLHPELPGTEDTIVDFPEGKVGVYTKFFDILGYYQIHLSQLFVIGATKVGHFEITCCVLNIIPTLNLFRMFYIPSYNSGWMSFSKRPGKNTSQCYTKPLDSFLLGGRESISNCRGMAHSLGTSIDLLLLLWKDRIPFEGMR
ncbi:hypothetical protein Tco_1251659 [Tanacetum coccineum]